MGTDAFSRQFCCVIMDPLIAVSPASGFSLDNLPWGAFVRKGEERRCIGVALGDHVVDVGALHSAGLLSGLHLARSDCFQQVTHLRLPICLCKDRSPDASPEVL